MKLDAATKKMEKTQKQLEKKAKKASASAGPAGVIKEPKRRQPAKAAPRQEPEKDDDIECRVLPTWPDVAAWMCFKA